MPDLNREVLAVLEEAREALSCCYNVMEWPADGTSEQDAALAKVTDLLVRLSASPAAVPNQETYRILSDLADECERPTAHEGNHLRQIASSLRKAAEHLRAAVPESAEVAGEVREADENLVTRIQNIMSRHLHVDDEGDIMGTGQVSYEIARALATKEGGQADLPKVTPVQLASFIEQMAENPKGGKMAAIAYKHCARLIREKLS